jgi:[acyl-carrier-protein] S-malonyltransferase
MSTAFVFPGQGSQFIGMGQELCDAFAEAREVFQEVDNAIDFNLSKLMFSGDEAELTLTTNAQPAIMAVSIATVRVLEKHFGRDASELCQFMAGHSLGEYSALCAAGVFSLADTAKLVRFRGQAMQNAVPIGLGSMVALVGSDIETAQKVAELASAFGICEIANDNGAGQVVLSGEAIAIDKVVEIHKEYGIKRAVKLPVSAPFHSSLMQPAAEAMRAELEKYTSMEAKVDVIPNVSVVPTRDPEELKRSLVRQVAGRVRWRETYDLLQKKRVEKICEIGPGKVLSTIAGRMFKDEIKACHCGTPSELDELVKQF